jgi:flagellin
VATGAGTIEITVNAEGWSEPRTYKANIEVGDTQAQATDKLATLINDANIGISAFREAGNATGLNLVSVNELAAGSASGAAEAGKISLSVGSGATAVTGSTVDQTLQEMNLSTVRGAQEAIITIDQAIESIDAQRASLGAVQNRFENTIGNLQNIGENVSAARGRIQDTDYASETANMSKQQIMQQAGTAILAQANQLPQAVLSLLR